MKELENSFRLNGLQYTLIQRNDRVAMFGIGGSYTDRITHWEVCKIQIRKDQYGIRESIPQNDIFGRDRSRCFANEKLALLYYDELTLKLCQKVPDDVSGVEENTEILSEYQVL